VKFPLDPDPIFKSLKRNKSFLGYLTFRFMNYLKYSKKLREKIYYGNN